MCSCRFIGMNFLIMSEPLVSIIIPAKNAEKTVRGCIESIFKLDYENFELLFVNDGSNDSTEQILENFVKVKVIKTTGVGPSAARNAAIREAKGSYIAFTDADCIVHPQWLNELLKGFKDDKTAAVGGNQLSPDTDTDFGKSIQAFLKIVGFVADYVKKKEEDIVETNHSPTCNVMYRKQALDDAGGFLEGLWPGEDLELDYRLRKKGWRFFYNPKAVVYHFRSGTLKKFNKMMFSYGRAQGYLVAKYGPFRRIHFVPMVLVVAAGLYLGGAKKLLVLFVCGISVLIYLWMLVKTGSLSKSLRFCGYLACTMFFWTLGFVYEIIFRRYKVNSVQEV